MKVKLTIIIVERSRTRCRAIGKIDSECQNGFGEQFIIIASNISMVQISTFHDFSLQLNMSVRRLERILQALNLQPESLKVRFMTRTYPLTA